MKKRRILFIAATMASALPAAAQQDAADDVEFCPHAYIQAHGGAQYTLGEAPFGDLVSPTVQLGVGYRFLPWMGARLAVGAWQSKGGFNGYTATGRRATSLTLTTTWRRPSTWCSTSRRP